MITRDCIFREVEKHRWICIDCGKQWHGSSPPRRNCTALICIYIGEKFKTIEDELGCCKHQISVFHCKLHGECTVKRFKEKQESPVPCILCKDRTVETQENIQKDNKTSTTST